MFNFTHKPDCPDGKNAKLIATKIRKKTEIEQTNKLEFLLSRHRNKTNSTNKSFRNK